MFCIVFGILICLLVGISLAIHRYFALLLTEWIVVIEAFNIYV